MIDSSTPPNDDNIILPLADKKKKKHRSTNPPRRVRLILGCLVGLLIVVSVPIVAVWLAFGWPVMKDDWISARTRYRPSVQIKGCIGSAMNGDLYVREIAWTPDPIEQVRAYYASQPSPFGVKIQPSIPEVWHSLDNMVIPCYSEREERERLAAQFPDGTIIETYRSYYNMP
jgi:hypothetical protein